MPKLKPSLGQIEIASPMGTHFVSWFKQEVVNFYEWNPSIGSWPSANVFKTKYATIEFKKNTVVVISALPRVWLRQGMCINMGHGRIEIG